MGILKSLNAGETWEHSFEGIGSGGRFHLAISSQNPRKIYTSVEAVSEFGAPQTHVYLSVNEGENWS
ncbi:MAG: hypothetical protein HC906_06195 [Bacteroidales bacterium]|nr:hypothetical protein [Bacteroidales bacterium]